MSQETVLFLNRSGLTLGFLGSLCLAIGILGEERVQKFERLGYQVLLILKNPLRFIKTSFSDEKPDWLVYFVFLLSLLFYAMPTILHKQIEAIPILSTLWKWALWRWGLPIWLFLAPITIIFFLALIVIFRSGTRALSSPTFRLVAKVLAPIIFIYMAPVLPFGLIMLPTWFLLLALTSSVLWVLTLPVQMGYSLQNRFGLTGAYESAGILMLCFAFLTQLIATF